MESRTRLRQPLTVVAATRAVVNMEALVQRIVTGLVIAIKTRVTMKKKKWRKITLESHAMALQMIIKRTLIRRVLHGLSGRAYLTAVLVFNNGKCIYACSMLYLEYNGISLGKFEFGLVANNYFRLELNM